MHFWYKNMKSIINCYFKVLLQIMKKFPLYKMGQSIIKKLCLPILEKNSVRFHFQTYRYYKNLENYFAVQQALQNGA